MISTNEIARLGREHLPVVCGADANAPIGRVDYVVGDWIQLTSDEAGQYHFIPLAWIKSVDDKAHLDRTGREAMDHWRTSPVEAMRAAEGAEHENDVIQGRPAAEMGELVADANRPRN